MGHDVVHLAGDPGAFVGDGVLRPPLLFGARPVGQFDERLHVGPTRADPEPEHHADQQHDGPEERAGRVMEPDDARDDEHDDGRGRAGPGRPDTDPGDDGDHDQQDEGWQRDRERDCCGDGGHRERDDRCPSPECADHDPRDEQHRRAEGCAVERLQRQELARGHQFVDDDEQHVDGPRPLGDPALQGTRARWCRGRGRHAPTVPRAQEPGSGKARKINTINTDLISCPSDIAYRT